MFGRKRTKIAPDDLRRADLTISTQRLGIRFGERIRDVFRFRWLRQVTRDENTSEGN